MSGHLYGEPKKAPAKTWTISKLLSRYGRYQNFRVNGTAWTFSCTICVDPWGDESGSLVEITRVKFMQSQEARDLPLEFLRVERARAD